MVARGFGAAMFHDLALKLGGLCIGLAHHACERPRQHADSEYRGRKQEAHRNGQSGCQRHRRARAMFVTPRLQIGGAGDGPHASRPKGNITGSDGRRRWTLCGFKTTRNRRQQLGRFERLLQAPDRARPGRHGQEGACSGWIACEMT